MSGAAEYERLVAEAAIAAGCDPETAYRIVSDEADFRDGPEPLDPPPNLLILREWRMNRPPDFDPELFTEYVPWEDVCRENRDDGGL